jgi:hypothetical protein
MLRLRTACALSANGRDETASSNGEVMPPAHHEQSPIHHPGQAAQPRDPESRGGTCDRYLDLNDRMRRDMLEAGATGMEG